MRAYLSQLNFLLNPAFFCRDFVSSNCDKALVSSGFLEFPSCGYDHEVLRVDQRQITKPDDCLSALRRSPLANPHRRHHGVAADPLSSSKPASRSQAQTIARKALTSNQLIIAIWAAFVILAGVVLGSTLRIDDDLTVFLPSDGSAVEDLLFTRLREGPAARLILVALEGGSPEETARRRARRRRRNSRHGIGWSASIMVSRPSRP